MVEHLDACPDCYEEYAETVRFLQDEEPGGRVVVLGRENRTRSLRPLFWTAAAIAAVLVAAVVVPGLLDGPRLGDEGLAAARLVSSLASPERTLEHIVSRPAPGSFPSFGTQPRSSFQAGVATVDLRVALAARDRARALAVASALPRSSGALVSAIEHELWKDASRELSSIEGSRSEGAGANDFLAGARAEAGRLAAASGDAEFFRTEPGRAAYEALRERLGEAAPPLDDLEALEEEFVRWVREP